MVAPVSINIRIRWSPMLPSTRNCLGSPLLRKGLICTIFRALGATPSRVTSLVGSPSEVGTPSSNALVVDVEALALPMCESISLNLVDLSAVRLLNLVSRVLLVVRVSLELLNLVLVVPVVPAVLNLVPGMSLLARASRDALCVIAAQPGASGASSAAGSWPAETWRLIWRAIRRG